MVIIATILATVISALCYRFGGCSKEEGKQKYPWVPSMAFKSWVRDWIIPLVITGWMLLCYPGVPWWAYLVSIALMGGALSTYWDRLFGFDNFWFHGFMFGAAKLMFAIFSGMWLGFGIHCLVSALAMGSISVSSRDVDVEEFGRGAVTGIALPLLMI